MAAIRLEVRSPIGYIAFPHELSEGEIRDFYRRYGEALQKEEVRGDVWDLSNVNALTQLKHRELIAASVQRLTPILNHSLRVSARVVPNSLTRGIVSTVDWLTGDYRYPVRNFETRMEAESFAVETLK